MAYQQGYALAHRYWGVAYNRITETQALQQLGLFPGASERGVKNRYHQHQLSLENHPDKCKTQVCAENWSEISEAYQVLYEKARCKPQIITVYSAKKI